MLTRVQFCLQMIREKMDECDSSIPGNLKIGFPESEIDTQEGRMDGFQPGVDKLVIHYLFNLKG